MVSPGALLLPQTLAMCENSARALSNTRWLAIQGKRGGIGITGCPRAIETDRDRRARSNRSVVGKVGHCHLAAALRKGSVPALGYLLTGREAEDQRPAVNGC